MLAGGWRLLNVYVFLNQLLAGARYSSSLQSWLTLAAPSLVRLGYSGCGVRVIFIFISGRGVSLCKDNAQKNTIERAGGIGLSCFMFVFCPANLVVMKVTDTPGVRHYWGVGTRGQHRNEEDVGMLFSIIVFNSPAQSLPLDIRDAKKEMSLLPGP